MTALHEEFAVPVDLPARNNKKRDLTSKKKKFIRAKNKNKSSPIQPHLREDIPPFKLSGLRAELSGQKTYQIL